MAAPLRAVRDISDPAVLLYETLQLRGASKRSTIDEQVGLAPAAAARAWGELGSLGLVRVLGSTDTVIAVGAHAALADVVSRQRSVLRTAAGELDQLGRASETLLDRFGSGMGSGHEGGVNFEIIEGDQNYRNQVLRERNRHTRVQALSMHPGPIGPPEIMAASLEEDRELAGRGVSVRAIYGQAVLNAPRARRFLTELFEAGGQVRIARSVPYNLLISDHDTAYLPSGNPTPNLMSVQGALLVANFISLYEHFWLEATPYRPHDNAWEKDEAAAHAGGLSDLQVQILSLLSNGLGDEAISRRLGVSTRTMRRLLANAMESLGAESRFQAGVIAANRGLLADCVT